MAKQFLNRNDISISIQQLGGHRMPEPVASYGHTTFLSIMLYPFLYGTDRDRLSSAASLLSQEDLLLISFWSLPQVLCQCHCCIIADIDDSIPGTFAGFDQNPAASVINNVNGQVNHLLDTQTTAQHHNKDSKV